jgi:hypothetical protein
MTTEAAEAVAPPKPNVFERAAGVLFTPAETFGAIARRPDILGPLLLLLAVSVVTTILIVPRMDFDEAFRQQMAQSGREMSPADEERALRFAGAVGKTMAYFGPLWSIAFYAIIAGILLFAFRFMGGEGTFKQAFSATLYSWIPMTLFTIILTIVVLVRGTLDPTTMATAVKSNLAFLVDPVEQRVLFALLGSLDIFTIWTLILLTFGFSSLSKMSRATSAAIVVSLWVITVVLRVGWIATVGSPG